MKVRNLIALLVFLLLNSCETSVEAAELSSQTTRCGDGFGLNYTLPMFDECKKMLSTDGRLIQSIPKLVPIPPALDARCRKRSERGIPPGRRMCRLPDCLRNPCFEGWCEETMTGYQCHCPHGRSGKRCQKMAMIPTSQAPASMAISSTDARSPESNGSSNAFNYTPQQGPTTKESRSIPINSTSNTAATTAEQESPTTSSTSNAVTIPTEPRSTPSSAKTNNRSTATGTGSTATSHSASTERDLISSLNISSFCQQFQMRQNATTCPDGWVSGPKKCYRISNATFLKWDLSHDYCNSLPRLLVGRVTKYPSLLVPERDNEVRYLRDCVFPLIDLEAKREDRFCINCKLVSEDEYSCNTTRDGNITDYRDWSAKQLPDDAKKFECVYMSRKNDWQWNDYGCGARCFSVCQIHID